MRSPLRALEPDRDFLRAVVDPPARSLADQIGTTFAQIARAILLCGLCVALSAMARAQWSEVRAGTLEGFRREQWLGMVLWTWGASVLVVELAVLMIRDAWRTPYLGSRVTGTRVLLRSLGSMVTLALVSAVGWPLPVTWLVQLCLALVFFAWQVPAALRGAITCLTGLRSLFALGPPTSPALLARKPGRHGRRIVQGRLTAGPGLVLEDQGVLARLDPTIDALHFDDPRGAVSAIARAHVDDVGYRSAGLRLEPDGLPVWLLASDGIEARLAGFRRRLGLVLVLDGARVVTAAAGLGLLILLFGAAILR